MSYISFLKQVSKNKPVTRPINFLVSGQDTLIGNVVLKNIYEENMRKRKNLLILDDLGNDEILNTSTIRTLGYKIEDGMSGEYLLYNLFQVSTVKEISRLRELLNIMEYNESKKQKLIAYLHFIKHLEALSKKEHNPILTLEVLSNYSSTMLVEKKIQDLLLKNIITSEQQIYFLSKYMEICEAAADFENTLYLLIPYIRGKRSIFENNDCKAFIFKINELGTDVVMKSLLTQLLLYSIEDTSQNTTVIILDKGNGAKKYILNFLVSLNKKEELHIFSEDIFTITSASELPMILNKFEVKIYSKHLAMDSCLAIEKTMGDIDIVKKSYTATYDRRWNANKVWDIILGNNKTETYIANPTCREPRYRKEMIASFPKGNGIIEYMGNSSLFSIL